MPAFTDTDFIKLSKVLYCTVINLIIYVTNTQFTCLIYIRLFVIIYLAEFKCLFFSAKHEQGQWTAGTAMQESRRAGRSRQAVKSSDDQ